ncbi:hypothetical protein KI387_011583, partial [Taxus chinensis]
DPRASMIPIEEVVPISNFNPESTKRTQEFTVQGRANDEWISTIVEKGRSLLQEAVKLFSYMCATTNKPRMIREDLEKEKDHWDSVYPL